VEEDLFSKQVVLPILSISQKIQIFKGGKTMAYRKPTVIAESVVQMADCRPNSKPSGRPCNPPGPGGRR